MNFFLNNLFLCIIINIYRLYDKNNVLPNFKIELYKSFVINNFFQIESITKINAFANEINQHFIPDFDPNTLPLFSTKSKEVLPLPRGIPLNLHPSLNENCKEISSYYPKTILKLKEKIIIEEKILPKLSDNEIFVCLVLLLQSLGISLLIWN